jgi:phosphoribosylformylglycinamidine cyclo-ligase
MAESGGLTYAKAGVDTSKQKQAIRALAGELTFARRGDGRPLTDFTQFAGLVRFRDHALAICTDGVGTKIEVANRLRRWDTIGIDAIAMNVNDCICVGAEPLAFVDYLAVAEPDPVVSKQIGKGLNKGARLANVTLVGGETAIMPEVINGMDLAGTCVGAVPVDEVVDGKKVRHGDVLVGLESSGPHSNGYTLVRRLLDMKGIALDGPCPGTGGRTWGDVLLEPTRIYVRPVMTLLDRVEVRGLANVTGGGLANVPRINPKRHYLVDTPPPVAPVFEAIHALGGIEWEEMYRTFNMGLGFCVAVPEDAADEAVKILNREGAAAQVVGRVERGRDLLHEPTGFRFQSKT